MPLAAELELPSFDHTDASLRGERYRRAMAELRGLDGWLAASPFGFIVLDREAGEFFLRSDRLLTFGAGVHYCVGANLARAEMEEALAFLAERLSSLALDGEPEFGAPSGIYGLEKLPLKLVFEPED